MSGGWKNSRRREQLPPGWPRIVKRIKRRDPICRWPDGCDQPSTDVDHIGDPADHSDENLQGLCNPHHLRKTVMQRPPRAPRTRPPEPHPGAL